MVGTSGTSGTYLVKAGTRSQIVSKIDQLVLILTTNQVDKLPFSWKIEAKKS